MKKIFYTEQHLSKSLKVSFAPVQCTKIFEGEMSQLFDKNLEEINLIKDCF